MDYSNIPGPGGTTFDNNIAYEFFRQRFRLGIDIRLVDDSAKAKAGVYTQLEYRGGWGGGSPVSSETPEALRQPLTLTTDFSREASDTDLFITITLQNYLKYWSEF